MPALTDVQKRDFELKKLVDRLHQTGLVTKSDRLYSHMKRLADQGDMVKLQDIINRLWEKGGKKTEKKGNAPSIKELFKNIPGTVGHRTIPSLGGFRKEVEDFSRFRGEPLQGNPQTLPELEQYVRDRFGVDPDNLIGYNNPQYDPQLTKLANALTQARNEAAQPWPQDPKNIAEPALGWDALQRAIATAGGDPNPAQPVKSLLGKPIEKAPADARLQLAEAINAAGAPQFPGELVARHGPEYDKLVEQASEIAKRAKDYSDQEALANEGLTNVMTNQKGADWTGQAIRNVSEKPFEAQDFARMAEERLGSRDEYMKEIEREAVEAFDRNFAPIMRAQLSAAGGGTRDSGTESTVQNAKKQYIQDAMRGARQEYQKFAQQERNIAGSQALASRAGVLHGSEAERNRMSSELQRAILGQQQAQAQKRGQLGVEMAGAAHQHGLLEGKRNIEQTAIDAAVQQQNQMEAARRSGIVTQAQIIGEQPVTHAMPPHTGGFVPPVSAMSTLGQVAAPLLGQAIGMPQQAQPHAHGGRVYQHHDAGGTPHMPPQYTDAQLGMDSPQIQHMNQMAQYAANVPINPTAQFASHLGRMFDRPAGGGYANAGQIMQEALQAKYDAEDKIHAHKLKSADIMGKIHDSRMAQRKVLMDYHHDRDKMLWERAHKSEELSHKKNLLESLTEHRHGQSDYKKEYEKRQWAKHGLEEKKYDQQHVVQLTKDLMKDAPQRLQNMDQMSRIIHTIEEAQNAVDSGSLFTLATNDARLLDLVPGVGNQHAIDVLNTAPAALARLWDTLSKEGGIGGARSQEMALAAKGIGMGLSSETGKKSLREMKSFLGDYHPLLKKMITSISEGNDKDAIKIYREFLNGEPIGSRMDTQKNERRYEDLSKEELAELKELMGIED